MQERAIQLRQGGATCVCKGCVPILSVIVRSYAQRALVVKLTEVVEDYWRGRIPRRGT